MKYLLDTDICIYLINGKSAELLRRLTRAKPEDVAVSSVTLFELATGAYKSRQVAKNELALTRFLAPMEVLAFDETAALDTARIRTALEKAGKRIGAYDLMLAGHARCLGATLVTNNVREFTRVQGLKVENWLASGHHDA